MSINKKTSETYPNWFIEKWQEIADVLAEIIDISAALIMKYDNESMEVFVSSQSENNPYSAGVKEKWGGLYCETVIKTQKKLVIPNALKDENWNKNPDLKHNMVAYMGFPLNYPDKKPFGTLCILDNKENPFTAKEEKLVEKFKKIVELDLALIQSFEIKTNQLELSVAKEVADHKKTEESLIKSEANLITLVDSLPDMVWLKDENGKYLYCNQRFEQYYGKEKKEIIGKTNYDFIDKESADFFKEKDKVVLSSKNPLVYEEQNVFAADGHTEISETIKAPVYQADGKLIGILGIRRDITERKQNEELIIKSELRFRQITENSPLAISITSDIEQKAEFRNNTFYKLFGYTKEEISGINDWWTLAYPDKEYRKQINEQWNKNVAVAIENRTKIEPMESIVTCKDGSIKHIIWNFISTEEQDFIFGIDLTSQKHTEEKLRESEEQSNAILNAVPDSFFRLNKEGDYLDYRLSNRSESLLAPEQFLGKNIKEIMPATIAETAIEAIDKALRTDLIVMYNYQLDINGETRYYESRIVPISNKNVISFVRDITEGKQADEKLASFNRDFETFLEQTTDFIYFKDINGRFRFCSQTIADITGHKHWHELIGKNDREVFPADIAQIYEEEEIPVFSKGKPIINNLSPYYDANGKKGYVETSKWPIFNDLGEITGLFGISRNISERIKAEETLRKSEHSLKEAQRVAHIGSWEIDLITNHLKWSDEVYNIIEKNPKKTFTYEDFLEIVHPEDREALNNTFLESVANKTKYEIVHRIVFPDGRIKYLHEQGKTYYDEEGNPVRSVGTAQDITERKRTEEIIIQKEQKFRVLTETSPLAIYMSSGLEQKAEYINPAFSRLFGYTLDEVPSVTIWWPLAYPNENYRKQISEKWNENVANAIETHSEIEPMETVVTCKDGSEKYISWGFIAMGEQNWAFGQDLTERKKAEDAMTASEQKYRLLSETAEDIIIGYDVNNKLTYINSFALELIGKTETESLNKNIGEFIPKEFHEELRKNYQERLDGFLGSRLNEMAIIGKDGKNIPLEVRTSPIVKDGEIKGYISIARDITKRKKAEEILQISEEKYRLLTETAQDFIIGYKNNGTLTYINSYGLELLGFSENDYTQKNVFDLIPEKYRAVLGKNREERAKGFHGSRLFELEIINKDGILVPFEIHSSPIMVDGEIKGFISICRDITERKRTEGELQKFSIAVEQSPVSIIITDLAPKIIYANFKNYETSGYKQEELVGENPGKIKSGKIKKEVYKELWDTITSGKVWHGELCNRRKNGELYWENTSITPIVDSNGITTHYLSLKEDITEHKKMTNELILAKNAAEESDRLKSAFIANMSHEIRTPMNGILGFSELLKEPNLTGEEQQEYLKIIEISCARMLNIVDEIMDISKIESGVMEISYSEIKINEKLEYIHKLLTPLANEKKINLSLKNNLSAKEYFLKTDVDKFYSILTNIIKNAIKYTDEGTIEFGYYKMGEFLEFYVEDTGIGIPLNRHEAVFERLFKPILLIYKHVRELV